MTTINHSYRAHAKLSASGSSRWLNCPGSVKAEAGYKNTTSIYAAEGTLAHELADTALKANKDASAYIGTELKGAIITEEMASWVQKYLDYVLAFETNNCQKFTEERVDFSNVVPEGFGTLDFAILDFDSRTCHIFDLKYGMRPVDAFENTQGQLYALGLLNELEFLDTIDNFVIHIVQPRVYNYSSWGISVADLKKFGKFVAERAALSLTDSAPRVPGEQQCQWCKAKADCPALFKFTQDIISAEFDNLDELPSVSAMTASQKKQVIDNKALIESFLKAVAEDAEQTLLSGGNFPGYKLVQGRSARKYKETAESFLAEQLGDDAYTKSLITLTAAEKLVDKEALAEHLYKPEGKPKMVPETAKGIPFVTVDCSFEDLTK